jgi:pre-mRNA-splicing factor 18
MKLAIGNARWPLGVTMVGIHARAGRERIESAKVGHLMTSDAERRYTLSFKRLLTFCQTKYPPDETSKLVGV